MVNITESTELPVRPKSAEMGGWLRLRHAACDLLEEIDVLDNTNLDCNIVNAFRRRLNLSPIKYSERNGLQYLKLELIKTISEAGGKIDTSADIDLLMQTLEKLVATEISESGQED